MCVFKKYVKYIISVQPNLKELVNTQMRTIGGYGLTSAKTKCKLKFFACYWKTKG